MMTNRKLKKIAFKLGADLCGISSVDRYTQAPYGFHPTDIYKKCKSVLVFALKVPSGSLNANTCIPYTHINNLITQKVDNLTLKLSILLEKNKIKNIIIPSDDPYEYWESENLYGRAILSLRHAGYLSGLGYLGKNTLLINKRYGSMIQIGALLLDIEFESDKMIDYSCPSDCDICINKCPSGALNGISVNQKLCRPTSIVKNEKGYILKNCYECRKRCPKNILRTSGSRKRYRQ